MTLVGEAEACESWISWFLPTGSQPHGEHPRPAPCWKNPSLQRSQWRPVVLPWQWMQWSPRLSWRQYCDLPLQEHRPLAARGENIWI